MSLRDFVKIVRIVGFLTLLFVYFIRLMRILMAKWDKCLILKIC